MYGWKEVEISRVRRRQKKTECAYIVPHNFKPGVKRHSLEQRPCVFLLPVVCSIGASFASAYSMDD
eukprot:scaffold55275_cov48-Attheya_sp.AAC.2